MHTAPPHQQTLSSAAGGLKPHTASSLQGERSEGSEDKGKSADLLTGLTTDDQTDQTDRLLTITDLHAFARRVRSDTMKSLVVWARCESSARLVSWRLCAPHVRRELQCTGGEQRVCAFL